MNTLETAGETISAGTETFEASHIDVIETVIASLDQEGDAMVSRSDDDSYLWKFTYGSVIVYVQLTGTEDEDSLTVWSPLLKLPVVNQTALMQELLSMNCGETFEACFGISNQDVLILAGRWIFALKYIVLFICNSCHNCHQSRNLTGINISENTAS
ncbi:MAG: YbjN domain-containing protein [Cyanobacteria bacterium J06628_4]